MGGSWSNQAKTSFITLHAQLITQQCVNCVNQNSVESPLVEDASVASSVQVENQQRIIMETNVGQLDFYGQDV